MSYRMCMLLLVVLITCNFNEKVLALCADSDTLSLDFTNKGISDVGGALFAGCNPVASAIDLSWNTITALEFNAFAIYDFNNQKYVPFSQNLRSLNLSNNRISNISDKALTFSRNLLLLDLTNNSLTELKSGIFDSLPRLERLILSKNRISIIENGTFTSNLRNLKMIDLQHNQLTSMEMWPYTIKPSSMLFIFDVRHNMINQFTNNLNYTYDLEPPYKTMTYLDFNKFTVWNDTWFTQYHPHNRKRFYLSDLSNYILVMSVNPWVCDYHMCQLVSSYQSFILGDVLSRLIVCENPQELRQRPLTSLSTQVLHCNTSVPIIR
ncbi:unnamed protein product [Mytilus coruscus]|uniref:Uncharacterized protein n=1 Tax=Mytilus coruscus TaxID=42192 RepID=A0A6J8DXS8_MYTCO|nr:unnamed protein product [Mytilus coruscus]